MSVRECVFFSWSRKMHNQRSRFLEQTDFEVPNFLTFREERERESDCISGDELLGIIGMEILYGNTHFECFVF